MRRARALTLPLLALAAAPALAQTVVTSPAPDRVAVTVYRDPHRPAERAPNLHWLNGYALISETRQVQLPAGETELRFEVVAGGILPQSAIVRGLPDGIVERNRDAYLLSPATLVDRSLGRRVHLRRTSRATGAVTEQEAIVRSGAGGAVVIESEAGVEALRCTGLAETLLHDGVPAGLSARPTLSVRARSRAPVTATVTLTYLSSGMDWQANYVATLSEDESRMDLFAWLTLASMDETSFVAADTQAVAGRLNRAYVQPQRSEGGPLILRCWPHGTTSDIAEEGGVGEQIVVTGSRMRMADAPPPPPPPPPPAMVAGFAMQAQQEELGDLKLYRIPEPVTVAAKSQKQVALLPRTDIAVRLVYRLRFHPVAQTFSAPAQRVLVTRNRSTEGLGLPLPAGGLMLFDSGNIRPILLGRGTVRDYAVGEDVEAVLGAATGVRATLTPLARTASELSYSLVVTNDRPRPVRFEAELVEGDHRLRADVRLARRNGMPLWSVTVPANGTATLRYRLVAPRAARRR
jgi:hypothetical protein